MNECCIFKNDGDSVRKINLERMSLVRDFDSCGSRYTHYLLRCPDCGKLVFYKCEEVADFLSDDDHEDYYETLFPVESMEEACEIAAEFPFDGFPGERPTLRRMRCSREEYSGQWFYKGV